MFLDIIMGRKHRIGLTLTPRSLALLDALVDQTMLSRADVLDAIAQGQIQLLAPEAQWSFHITAIAEEDFVLTPRSTVDASTGNASTPPSSSMQPAADVSPVPAEAPRAPSEPDAEAILKAQLSDATDTITRLRAELATVRDQLTTAPAVPVASSNEAAPAAPKTTSESAPKAGPSTEWVSYLQNQLLAARSAQADLAAQVGRQTAELERLRQSLAQAQQMAAIGETQINRWQYKTFAQ